MFFMMLINLGWVFLALAIGLMMAKGMAGSDKLEIWIRAIFLVWLFS